MEDSIIVQLYWDRNQEAIPATANKYGRYCFSIANNILNNSEDSEECVNDAYLGTWNSIPPNRPAFLSTFLGKIVRRIAFNLYKHNHAEKRGGSNFTLVLDELAECADFSAEVEAKISQQELTEAINGFLATLSLKKRNLFVCRYWYADSIENIAKENGMSVNNVTVSLSRMRKKLRTYLEERGFEV